MAKSTNYAAYQQLRPLQGDVSQDMQYWNEDAARRRQEEQQQEEFAWKKQEADRLREEREREERVNNAKDNLKIFDKLKGSETNSRSLNDFQGEYLALAQEQAKELIIKQDEAYKNKDWDAEREARIKLSQLNNFADELKLATDIYTNSYATAKQQLAEGKIEQKDFEKWNENFQKGFQGFRAGISQDFKPYFIYKDINGDNVTDIKDAVGANDLQNYVGLPKFLPKLSVEDVAKRYAAEFKQHELTTDTGTVEHTTIGVPVDGIKKATKIDLYNADGSYTQEMQSLANSLGYDPYNIKPEEAKDIETKILEASQPLYETKDKTNKTPSTRGSGSSNKSEPINLNGFNVTETDFGTFAKSVDTQKYQGINVPSKKLSSNSKPTKLVLEAPENGEESNFMVDKFTVGSQNGNDVIIVSGNYVTDEGASNEIMGEDGRVKVKAPEKRKRAEIVLSEAEVSDLASWIGKDPYDVALKPKDKDTGEAPKEAPKTSNKSSVL